jgi:hypothetical protein
VSETRPPSTARQVGVPADEAAAHVDAVAIAPQECADRQVLGDR